MTHHHGDTIWVAEVVEVSLSFVIRLRSFEPALGQKLKLFQRRPWMGSEVRDNAMLSLWSSLSSAVNQLFERYFWYRDPSEQPGKVSLAWQTRMNLAIRTRSHDDEVQAAVCS